MSKANSLQKSRKVQKTKLKENKIYLEGTIIETLPSVRFIVRIERPNGLEPLDLLCNTTALFKKRKNIKIIKGDRVVVELDPNDLNQGTIIERK